MRRHLLSPPPPLAAPAEDALTDGLGNVVHQGTMSGVQRLLLDLHEAFGLHDQDFNPLKNE